METTKKKNKLVFSTFIRQLPLEFFFPSAKSCWSNVITGVWFGFSFFIAAAITLNEWRIITGECASSVTRGSIQFIEGKQFSSPA